MQKETNKFGDSTMKIRKPLKMFYVDSNWNNFGDKSKYDIPHLMHERNVYLQLVLNFQHPEAWNEFIQDKYVDEVYNHSRLKAPDFSHGEWSGLSEKTWIS